ncbi:MAG: mercury methylation ferredoxin HgcB [Deltaproteobacteria bacterium]|nr:mercury methylation ferredoxin HgcB [Deltaproteobacteria bacterium]
MKHMLYLKNVATLKLNPERCAGCGLCLEVCPQEVLYRVDGKIGIRSRDACMECGACSRNCPTGAITVESGVGCAAAIINSILGRQGSDCCCLDDKGGEKSGKGSSCC